MVYERRWVSAGLAVMILSLMACGEDEHGPGIPPVPLPSARGTVTLIDTGAPVTGAVVVLVDPLSVATRSVPTKTDSQGRYEVAERLAAGRYSLVLYTDSTVVFDRTSLYLTVEDGKTTMYDIRMLGAELWGRYKPSINGQVLDDSTGIPIAGAYVQAQEAGLGAVDTWAPLVGITLPSMAVTDRNGRFSVNPSLVTDESGEGCWFVPICISKSGYEATTLVGEGPELPGWGALLPCPDAGSDSILAVTIRLHPLGPSGVGPHGVGSLTGRVRLGDPGISGIRVAATLILSDNPDIWPAGKGLKVIPDRIATTDAQGRFTITGLVPGSYQIEPAYLPDDGYIHDDYFGPATSDTFSVVQAGRTVAVGDFFVARALQAISPRPGAAVSDTTRSFSWTPVPSTPGYTLLWYRVWYSDHFYERYSAESLPTCSWTLPDSLVLHHGDHIRWFAQAVGTAGSFPDTVEIGGFEEAATFTVG